MFATASAAPGLESSRLRQVPRWLWFNAAAFVIGLVPVVLACTVHDKGSSSDPACVRHCYTSLHEAGPGILAYIGAPDVICLLLFVLLHRKSTRRSHAADQAAWSLAALSFAIGVVGLTSSAGVLMLPVTVLTICAVAFAPLRAAPAGGRATVRAGLDVGPVPEMAGSWNSMRVTFSREAHQMGHHVSLGGVVQREMESVVGALDKEDVLNTDFLDGFEHALREQPAAVSDDVDLAPILAVDPTFDADGFRSLARETFLKVRDARGARDEQEYNGLLSPTMEREINAVIDGDVAAHRHHILSQLEIRAATIVSAGVDAGREQIGMRFVLGADEIDRDGDTETILADSHTVQQWAERWQFERDPSVDPTATDQQHALTFGPDAWMFAHRGWVVTSITRLDA